MPSRNHSQSILFFLLPEDLQHLLEIVESKRRLRYVENELYRTRKIPLFRSFREIPRLGVSQSGKITNDRSLLVLSRWGWLSRRRVEPRPGDTRFTIDQETMPASIVLRPGGLFEPKVIVRGSVGTTSTHRDSHRLLSDFAGALAHCASRHGEYFVGKEALRFCAQGARLVTIHADEPSEYDLALVLE